MNKQELIDAVASEVGISESAVAETIAAFLATVWNAVAFRGEKSQHSVSYAGPPWAVHGNTSWASNYPASTRHHSQYSGCSSPAG